MEFIMSVVLSGLCAAAFAAAAANHRERRKILILGGVPKDNGERSLFIRSVKFASETAAPLFLRCKLPRESEGTRLALVLAGLDEKIDASDLLSIRLMAVIAGAFMGMALFEWFLPFRAAAGACLGWLFVAVWIRERTRARRVSMELNLPGALDWLALSVEAGLDFSQALSRIAKRMSPGPLKAEFLRLESSVRMGVPRREALSELAARSGFPALSSFVALLIQADILGASIGPVLRSSASRLRNERFNRAERKGVAAAQKALIPVVLFIMPATFIVIFGPIIVRLVTGGFNSLF